MAEEAKLDQDGWTDNTNYDRFAKKIVSVFTNPKKKFVSRRSGAHFNTSCLLGSRSRTSTSPTPHHQDTFIFWLFDTIYRDLCLQETFIEEFINAQEKDKIANEIEKKKKKKHKKKTGLRKNQRKVCHNWLDPLDFENTNNCPIILENLTFEIYSR